MSFIPQVAKSISAVFTPISMSTFSFVIVDVTMPDVKSAAVKTTNQASTVGADGVIHDTFLPSGFADPGSIKFSTQYDTSAVAPVGTSATLLVYMPGSHTWTASNTILTDSTGTGKLGELMTGDLTFKLSGLPVVS